MAEIGYFDLYAAVVGNGSLTRAQMDANLATHFAAGRVVEARLTEFRRRVKELDPAGTSASAFVQAFGEEVRSGRIGGARSLPPQFRRLGPPKHLTLYEYLDSDTYVPDFTA